MLISPFTLTSLPPQEPSVSALKQQLATLTAALATLTEEKSKMEVNFQMDKKAMLVRRDLCLWYQWPHNAHIPTYTPPPHTHTHTSQTQQDSVSKQFQAERERTENEVMRLQQLLEEVENSCIK